MRAGRLIDDNGQMSVTVRAVAADDGVARARLWRESGRFFAGLDPSTGREPDSEGLVEWLDGIRGPQHFVPAQLSDPVVRRYESSFVKKKRKMSLALPLDALHRESVWGRAVLACRGGCSCG